MKKSKRPRRDPCGRPLDINTGWNNLFPKLTKKVLLTNRINTVLQNVWRDQYNTIFSNEYQSWFSQRCFVDQSVTCQLTNLCKNHIGFSHWERRGKSCEMVFVESRSIAL